MVILSKRAPFFVSPKIWRLPGRALPGKRAPSYFTNGIRQSYQESLFTGQEDLEEDELNEAEELDESDPFYFSEGPKL